MSKVDVFERSWCDVVFEGRNQQYGAYQLRKESSRHFTLALLSTLVGFVLLLKLPQVFSPLFAKALSAKVVEVGPYELIDPVVKDPDVTCGGGYPPPPDNPKLNTTVFTVVNNADEDNTPETPVENTDENGNTGTTTPGPENTGGLEGGGGNGPETPLEPEIMEPMIVVSDMPEFPGGEAAMMSYLSKNINYPSIAREEGIQGIVYVAFVVDKEGNVINTELARKLSGGCSEEALRVVKDMPRWKPGKHNGRPVMVRFTIPIKFSLK